MIMKRILNIIYCTVVIGLITGEVCLFVTMPPKPKPSIKIILTPIKPMLDRFKFLSMVESGDDDRAVGRAGEVSRYQIKKSVWQDHTKLPIASATNPFTAIAVARVIADERCKAFEKKFGRAPTDFEFYVLWNHPATYLYGNFKGIPKGVFDSADSFARLCE